MPTPPIHTVSCVPIAIRAGLKLPICGRFLIVYPASENIVFNSSKSMDGAGWGWVAVVICISGPCVPMVGIFGRLGRCICGAFGRAGIIGAGVVTVVDTGAVGIFSGLGDAV